MGLTCFSFEGLASPHPVSGERRQDIRHRASTSDVSPSFPQPSHLRPLALRVVSHTRCAVVRERLLSSGRVGLATGSYLGLEFCRLLALGLGWLEATFRGALRPSRHSSRGLTTGYAIWCHSSTVCDGPLRTIKYLWACVSTMWLLRAEGIGDSFFLLPRILWCWESFKSSQVPTLHTNTK